MHNLLLLTHVITLRRRCQAVSKFLFKVGQLALDAMAYQRGYRVAVRGSQLIERSLMGPQFNLDSGVVSAFVAGTVMGPHTYFAHDFKMVSQF